MQRHYVTSGVPFSLGRAGEHLAREIVFDLRRWKKLYGEGEAQLMARRAGETAMYPVPLIIDGDTAIWRVTKPDAEIAGEDGECELQYILEDGTLAKSEVWMVSVQPSMNYGTVDPPVEARPWLDKLNEHIENILELEETVKENTAQAVASAEVALSSEDMAAESAKNAEVAAAAAATAAEVATAAEDVAAESAKNAENAAEQAATSAENAAASEDAAAQAEKNAAASEENAATSEKNAAESAAQAASSAEQATASEEAAAESAKNAASSESAAADSATNAANSESSAKKSAAQAASSAERAAASEENAASSESAAADSATAADGAKTAAGEFATNAENSATNAANSETQAAASAERIENMSVEAVTLAPGSAATVENQSDGDALRLVFGLPVATPINGFFTLGVDEDSNLWVYSSEGGEPPEFEYNAETGDLYIIQEVEE